MTIPSTLPIGHWIAGYQIVRMIGQGGFGIVYEASNRVTGERVAIKEFYPSAMASRNGSTIVLNNAREASVYNSVLERFERTAGTQFQFKHPNILKVFNYVPADNTGYMITEYIEGDSLREFLHRYGGHFPSDKMFRATMEQVIGAIGYVHRQGHIHRDLAPDNVMVDPFEKPTVIDFGALKRDLRSSHAYSSVVMMREDYAPPEQQDPSLKQGFYTDVFALAGTMYCTLSGSPPPRAAARAFSFSDDPYVPIERVSKITCPPEIFAAIDSALKLPPRDRPQTMEDFASLLQWSPDFGDAADARSAALPRHEERTVEIDRTRVESIATPTRRTGAVLDAKAEGDVATVALQPDAQPDRAPEKSSPTPAPAGSIIQQKPRARSRDRMSAGILLIGLIGLPVVVLSIILGSLHSRDVHPTVVVKPPPFAAAPSPAPPPVQCPDPLLTPAVAPVELREGFRPDPYRRNVFAGGGQALSNCNAAWTGFASLAMNIQLIYRTAGKSSLSIAINPNVSTVLLVNAPSGSWHFDRSNGRLTFQRASDGRYGIWVGTNSSGWTPLVAVAISRK